jgi:hypothetical protein
MAAAAATAPIEEMPIARAAAIAVLRPVQVGGLSAGAVVGAGLGAAGAGEPGGAAYGMAWVGKVSVCAHGIWVVSSVRGVVVIGSPNVDG